MPSFRSKLTMTSPTLLLGHAGSHKAFFSMPPNVKSLEANARFGPETGGTSRRGDCHSAAPPLPLVGVSIWMKRGCQQNDRTLADGSRQQQARPPVAEGTAVGAVRRQLTWYKADCGCLQRKELAGLYRCAPPLTAAAQISTGIATVGHRRPRQLRPPPAGALPWCLYHSAPLARILCTRLCLQPRAAAWPRRAGGGRAGSSRWRDFCHSAAPPSTFSRRVNRDGEGWPAE